MSGVFLGLQKPHQEQVERKSGRYCTSVNVFASLPARLTSTWARCSLSGCSGRVLSTCSINAISRLSCLAPLVSFQLPAVSLLISQQKSKKFVRPPTVHPTR